MSVAVNPIIINTLENPSKNKIVCNIALLESFVLSLFSSLTLIPVIYDKNAGNNSRTHGEIKNKNRAQNPIKIHTSSIIHHHLTQLSRISPTNHPSHLTIYLNLII